MYANRESEEGRAAAFSRPPGIVPFNLNLAERGLQLTRAQTATLQINTGLLCNQFCRHCHLDAGPSRTEIMDAQTLGQVVAYAGRCAFEAIDITGGAPELNPDLGDWIGQLSPLAPRILLRSNLTALSRHENDDLIRVLASHRVVVFASFPSINASQSDSQRGNGVHQQSIDTLKRLNAMGYGQKGTGLELNLVANPTGAFVPAPQAQTEERFRGIMDRKHGIAFSHLFSFGNVPIGRFRAWLIESGNYTAYMQKLYASFNPCAIEGLMCRTLVSVGWDGYLYDCDFNLAQGFSMGSRKMHVSEMPGLPQPGSPIAVSDHCYTCTAGEGFT